MTRNHERPDPDKLLEAITAEPPGPGKSKGHLKIFLGYIAGVGKTFRMLSEAQEIKKRGHRIVVGIVETHGRNETEELTHGLEILPRRKVELGGITLEEMDLDEILRTKPDYVLVDELAHTNPPGFRHGKRYEDVEELVNAGFHIFTTLNIQHVESLKDTVKEFAGIEVKELVPDRILALADKIELVDLPTEELRQRLAEGKVYLPDKARQAMTQFFKEGNLLALRDIALRYAARKIENVIQYFTQKGTLGPFDTNSRIMVCVSSSPSSEHLIRLTYRFADQLNAEWFAVYVDPLRKILKENYKVQLEKNLQLAERLGARVIRLTGNREADEVVSFAKSENINLIIAGFSRRTWLEEFFKGSIVNKIIHKSSPAQVLVVEGHRQPSPTPPIPKISLAAKWNAKPFASSLLSVAATTLICWVLKSFIEIENFPILFVLPVLVSGALAGRWAGIIASFLAVGAFNFFFVHPLYTFSVTDYRFIPTFVVLFIVGAISSFLADLIRIQGEKAVQREKFVSSLYDLSKNLLVSHNLKEFLNISANYLSRAFEAGVIFLLPEKEGGLSLVAKDGNISGFTAHDFGVAIWVFEHDQRAGKGTDTLASAQWYFVPLRYKDKVLGVMGIEGMDVSLERQQLIESLTNVVSLGLVHYC